LVSRKNILKVAVPARVGRLVSLAGGWLLMTTLMIIALKRKDIIDLSFLQNNFMKFVIKFTISIPVQP
jgi:hypothetical protein